MIYYICGPYLMNVKTKLIDVHVIIHDVTWLIEQTNTVTQLS